MLRKLGVRFTLLNKILESQTHSALFALFINGAIKAKYKYQLAPLTCQDTNLRKVRFQIQRKLRQSTSKGNEFSARVSVSEISRPHFRKLLRKSLQMHCDVISS